jgi:hypothetical protein
MPTKTKSAADRKPASKAAAASPVARAPQAAASVVALLAQGSPEIDHNDCPPIQSPGIGHNGGLPVVLGDFLSEELLCEQLHIHPRTLKRWRDLGIGPPRTMIPGRKAYYSAFSVQRWLQSLEEQPPEPPRSPGRPPTRRRR